RVVLVGQRAHDRADIEGLLAVRVRLGGEDLADGGEVSIGVAVGVAGDVPRERVSGQGAARSRLAAGDVGVRAVGHEDVAGGGGVGGQLLCLPAVSPHPCVPADAVVVLGGHAAGEVQRLLAG